MARKKKQPAEPTQNAQEVQENTIDDTSIDKGFGIAQAAFLMSRAAKRYNKPAEEITLKEALEMVKKDPAELPNKDDADIKEALDLTIRTAEELTGKPATEITGADINKVLGENPPFVVSDETATVISNAADMAGNAQRIFATIATTINNVFHSAEFKAAAESAKIEANFTTAFAQHSAEISNFLHKAEEFNREILPFIVLEVADRTGEKNILANTGNAEPFSLEEIRAFLTEGETPDKEKSPFESEISRVLGLFSFDGKPATDEARELLEAANKRKATYTENIEVVEAITDIAESIEQAPNTEKAEIIKKLPARLKKLEEIDAIVQDRKPTKLNKPTDKVNASITQPLIRDTLLKKGQYRFAMIKDGNGHGVPVILGVNFNLDELKKAGIPANITAYDITMQQAIHTIYKDAYETGENIGEHGEVYTTPNQIWAQMGSRNKLKTNSQRKKFFNALDKNNTTTCDISTEKLLNQYSMDSEDNGNEVNVKEHYHETFINIGSYRGVIDGNEREIIIIYTDPILTTFAGDLGQITEIPLYVIQATGTLNDDNLAIASYLQHEIAYMKRHSERNKTINLEALKEKTGTIKRDKNLEKYIEELLTEYANPPQGESPFIDGFEKVKTGYKIKLCKPVRGEIPQKRNRTAKGKP